MAYPGYRPQYPPTPTGLRPQNRPTNQPVQHRNSRDSQPTTSHPGVRKVAGHTQFHVHPYPETTSLLHYSPSTPHQSYHSKFAPPHQPAPTSFSLLTSHFSLPTPAPALLPGLFNHKGIGWLVPRSHAPLNARFGCLCEDKGCTGSDGMAGRMIET